MAAGFPGHLLDSHFQRHAKPDSLALRRSGIRYVFHGSFFFPGSCQNLQRIHAFLLKTLRIIHSVLHGYARVLTLFHGAQFNGNREIFAAQLFNFSYNIQMETNPVFRIASIFIRTDIRG